MKYIERNNDVVLNQNDLEDLHTFNKFPVFMGCTTQSTTEDILFDMSWKISKSSGMIQLNPLLPLDIVYNAEHGSGTTGKLWDEHHEMFCNFVQKYNPKSICIEIWKNSDKKKICSFLNKNRYYLACKKRENFIFFKKNIKK